VFFVEKDTEGYVWKAIASGPWFMVPCQIARWLRAQC